MAKLFVSNDSDYISEIIEKNKAKGFDSYRRVFFRGGEIVRFDKLVNKVSNIYVEGSSDESNGFAIAVGTIIYKDKFAEKALKKIYEDYDGCVESIRSNCVGNFLLVIYKKENLVAFTDKYQVIKSYYVKGANWLISNSLMEVSSFSNVVNDIEDIDVFEVINESVLVGSFGEKTIYKKAKRLMGYQNLVLNDDGLETKDLHFKRNRYELANKSRDVVVSDYANKVLEITSKIKNIFSSVGIHQTGGLDNRTILAAMLNQDIEPTLMYGVGDTELTNTKDEDLKIVREYSSSLGLPLRILDWSTNITSDIDGYSRLFNKYGFYFSIYGGSERFFHEYERADCVLPEFLECGYFLENLRLREFARDIKSITLEEFVDDYLLGGAYGLPKGVLNSYASYRGEILSELVRQCGIYNIDLSNGITPDNFDEVRWIHARHTDNLMVNFLNNFTSSFSIFSQPELHDYPLDINHEFRDNASFQVSLIHKLYPKLMDFDVFTHGASHFLNRDKMELVPIKVNMTKKHKVGLQIKKYFGSKVLKLIKSTYLFVRKVFINKQSSCYSSFVKESIESSCLKNNLKITAYKNINGVYGMLLAQELFAVNKILKENLKK